ncbi:hypothetical protein Tco_1221479 [Tanacetum coccineum]
MCPSPLRPIYQLFSCYRPSDVSNDNSTSGFPPVLRYPHANKSKSISIEENNFNQNRRKQFQPRQIYRQRFINTVVNQPVAHQGHATQTHAFTSGFGTSFLGPDASCLITDSTVKRPTSFVQIQSRNPNPEPNVAPVVTPVPKASIPFPSRRNDERRKEKS